MSLPSDVDVHDVYLCVCLSWAGWLGISYNTRHTVLCLKTHLHVVPKSSKLKLYMLNGCETTQTIHPDTVILS